MTKNENMAGRDHFPKVSIWQQSVFCIQISAETAIINIWLSLDADTLKMCQGDENT